MLTLVEQEKIELKFKKDCEYCVTIINEILEVLK